jgi:hypothetical protein
MTLYAKICFYFDLYMLGRWGPGFELFDWYWIADYFLSLRRPVSALDSPRFRNHLSLTSVILYSQLAQLLQMRKFNMS